MATNLVYRYDKKKTRVRTLSASVAAGTPLLDPTDDRPAVAVTASGDYTETITENLPYGWGSVTDVAKGGAGLKGMETTLAYDGTWEFKVLTAQDSTPNGTDVYITAAGALTLASGGGNTAYGVVDIPTDYQIREDDSDAVVPVRIGN